MLIPKNRQLMRIINNQSRKIFLKFCYFSLVILLISCKKESTKEIENSSAITSTSAGKKEEQSTSKRIVVFGDSLTAGYGLDDIDDAYPGLIQSKIDSLGLSYTVVNSGISGETTAGGKNRIDWVLNQKPDVFILELGANDGLRGVPLSETKNNLQYMIDAVQKKYPDTKIILAGMQIPPNFGQDYTTEFKNIFPNLSKKNNINLIPFLLTDVGGIPELNQGDGIHPTKEGHKILAKNVWQILAPLL